MSAPPAASPDQPPAAAPPAPQPTEASHHTDAPTPTTAPHPAHAEHTADPSASRPAPPPTGAQPPAHPPSSLPPGIQPGPAPAATQTAAIPQHPGRMQSTVPSAGHQTDDPKYGIFRHYEGWLNLIVDLLHYFHARHFQLLMGAFSHQPDLTNPLQVGKFTESTHKLWTTIQAHEEQRQKTDLSRANQIQNQIINKLQALLLMAAHKFKASVSKLTHVLARMKHGEKISDLHEDPCVIAAAIRLQREDIRKQLELVLSAVASFQNKYRDSHLEETIIETLHQVFNSYATINPDSKFVQELKTISQGIVLQKESALLPEHITLRPHEESEALAMHFPYHDDPHVKPIHSGYLMHHQNRGFYVLTPTKVLVEVRNEHHSYVGESVDLNHYILVDPPAKGTEPRVLEFVLTDKKIINTKHRTRHFEASTNRFAKEWRDHILGRVHEEPKVPPKADASHPPAGTKPPAAPSHTDPHATPAPAPASTTTPKPPPAETHVADAHPPPAPATPPPAAAGHSDAPPPPPAA